MQEVAINDNFAKMTEALYVAEQSARQAVEMRSKVQKELALKEKEKKDRELRDLAIKARMDRLGGNAAAPPSLAARESTATVAGGGARYEEVRSCLLKTICTSMAQSRAMIDKAKNQSNQSIWLSGRSK